LAAFGVKTVLNLCEDKEYLTFRSGLSQREKLELAYFKYNVQEIRLPIPDRSAPTCEMLNAAVTIAQENKTPLLVHCRGGRERSVTCLGAILAVAYDLSCGDALALICEQREAAAPRSVQLRSLNIWEAKRNSHSNTLF
jgi:protein-tyrosine phosphatase